MQAQSTSDQISHPCTSTGERSQGFCLPKTDRAYWRQSHYFFKGPKHRFFICSYHLGLWRMEGGTDLRHLRSLKWEILGKDVGKWLLGSLCQDITDTTKIIFLEKSKTLPEEKPHPVGFCCPTHWNLAFPLSRILLIPPCIFL